VGVSVAAGGGAAHAAAGQGGHDGRTGETSSRRLTWFPAPASPPLGRYHYTRLYTAPGQLSSQSSGERSLYVRPVRLLSGVFDRGVACVQVADFVSRYMPAYRAYLPGLYGLDRDALPCLRIRVDKDRSPK
jgi:hypothetical protein